MIRATLLLLVAALLALSGPAGACPYPVDTPPNSEPSDYELVDGAHRIYVGRMEGDFEERFLVEETIKGEAAPFVDIEGAFGDGSLVLVALDETSGGLSLSAIYTVEPEDDWVRTVRLFAGISALDDEAREKEALRELRKAAKEDREGRYPEGLVSRIDRHFAIPTPNKSFSDLMDLYHGAELDDDRLAVIWALSHADHPETPGFFRGLLFGGEPAWLLEPLPDWFRSHEEELPPIEKLARIYLDFPQGERWPVLQLLSDSAEPEDGPLLWSLLPGSDRGEIQSLVPAALGPAAEEEPVPDWLELPRDERLRIDLTDLWLSPIDWDGKERLGALLREEGRWASARSPKELARLFEASEDPAERRQILVEIFGREDDEDETDLSLVWHLLRKAKEREPDLLLQRIAAIEPEDEEVAALYRAARTAEEREKVLWIAGAAWETDQLGKLAPLEGMVRAFLSCPHPQARLNLGSEIAENLAGAEDLPLMLEALYAGSEDDAWVLASYFAQHPSSEAVPVLRRALLPLLQGDSTLGEALAASGDPEILDVALKVLRMPGREDDEWALRIVNAAMPEASEPPEP